MWLIWFCERIFIKGRWTIPYQTASRSGGSGRILLKRILKTGSVFSATLNWLTKRATGILLSYLYGILTFLNRDSIIRVSETKWLAVVTRTLCGIMSRLNVSTITTSLTAGPRHNVRLTATSIQLCCATQPQFIETSSENTALLYTSTRFKTTRSATLIFDLYRWMRNTSA